MSLNDYEPEYELLRQRKLTEEYAAVKAEHPKVARRLGELVNRHGGRRARYRGLIRVRVQKRRSIIMTVLASLQTRIARFAVHSCKHARRSRWMDGYRKVVIRT